jgi:hypothetical protein
MYTKCFFHVNNNNHKQKFNYRWLKVNGTHYLRPFCSDVLVGNSESISSAPTAESSPDTTGLNANTRNDETNPNSVVDILQMASSNHGSAVTLTEGEHLAEAVVLGANAPGTGIPQQSTGNAILPSDQIHIDERRNQQSVVLSGEGDRQKFQAGQLFTGLSPAAPGLVPVSGPVSSGPIQNEAVISLHSVSSPIDAPLNNNPVVQKPRLRERFSNLPTAERHGIGGFFGRTKYLNTIYHALISNNTRSSSTAPAAFAIIGVAGQGKTQTAVRFASQHANVFDYIMWVHADSEHKLIQDFQEWALEVGLVTEPSSNPWNDANKLLGWLEQLGRLNTLFRSIF